MYDVDVCMIQKVSSVRQRLKKTFDLNANSYTYCFPKLCLYANRTYKITCNNFLRPQYITYFLFLSFIPSNTCKVIIKTP